MIISIQKSIVPAESQSMYKFFIKTDRTRIILKSQLFTGKQKIKKISEITILRRKLELNKRKIITI